MRGNDFDTIIAPMRQRMVNAIWRVVRDPDATEDVLQEVLVRVVEHFGRVQRHPNPPALLLRMCVNAGIDHVRRVRGKRRTVSHNSLNEVTDRRGDALDASVQEETRTRIVAALAGLPRREGEVMTLFALEDLSTSEIAHAMNCRESTVRVWIARARARLKSQLNGLGLGLEA